MLFAESPWASWMERHSRERPDHPLSLRADPPDPFLQMLGQKGDTCEAALLQDAFVSQGVAVIDLSAERGTKEARARRTALALAERPDIIYQAPLLDRGFFGVADFLVRDPSSGCYTVWDAKLSRTARPQHALQLCCYADMLGALQPAPPETLGLVLGGSIEHVLPLRLEQYAAHYRHVRDAFLRFHAQYDPAAAQRAKSTPPDSQRGRRTRGRRPGTRRPRAAGLELQA